MDSKQEAGRGCASCSPREAAKIVELPEVDGMHRCGSSTPSAAVSTSKMASSASSPRYSSSRILAFALIAVICGVLPAYFNLSTSLVTGSHLSAYRNSDNRHQPFQPSSEWNRDYDQYGEEDSSEQHIWYDSSNGLDHYRFTHREGTRSISKEWARIQAALIDTGFSCDFVVVPGYYADMESHCQMFHICTESKRKFSFFCPDGTYFNQKHLVCDWDGGNTCALSPYYYTSYSDHWYKVHRRRR